MDSAVVETTDVRERIMEEEPKVATKEFTSETGNYRANFRCTYLILNTKQYFIICMVVSHNW